jgi:hypothetical protein
MTTDPSIDQSLNQMTSQMKQLAQHGSTKNLRLSPQAYINWHNAIQEFITDLSAQLVAGANLTNYGPVGAWPSANDTVSNFRGNVISHGGFKDVGGKYLQYLEEFGNAVNAASNRLQAEDKSG